MASGPGELPEKFEEYQLLRLVGHGAMGRVYLARDTLLDRPVALKLMQRTTAAGRERFLHEARALARLQHPNVVTVFRVGETRGQPYIVSEYVRGGSLAELRLPVPWRRALELGLGLARGLAAAHRRGVLHRDVKPANAVLSEDGTVKLLDFGLAKLLGDAGEGPAPAPAADSLPDESVPRTFVPANTQLSGPSDTADSEASPLPVSGSDGTPFPASALAALHTMDSEASPLPASLPVQTPTPAHRTRQGAVMGTPLYMSPEAWRGEPATPRTDVWALGAVLYELCVGSAPFAEIPLAELPVHAQTHAAPPLEAQAPSVDAELARIVACCLERDPSQRYASAEGLREALERLAAPPLAGALPEGNPYRGLRAFDREHASLFFGRAGDVGAVLERLREGRWALVTADSGVGKSSLCRAGVLPAVESGALGTPAPARVTCIPTARPLASLADALAASLGMAPETLEAELAAAPEEVARRVWKAHPRGLLLFVDQLEELLTLAPRAEAEKMARALFAIAPEGTGRVRLLGTVRSDHFAQLAALPGLADVAARGLFVLAPLALEGLREAVTGPARAKGFGFESPALVETLAQAGLAGEGALPLLQFTLAELWERRDDGRRLLTQAALAELGGVEGCLARHGDAVLAGLLPAQQAAARDVLLSLVTPEGTRARRTEAELLRGGPEAKVALEALVRGRLLAVGGGEHGDGATFELAHEALLLHWGTLREWLATGAEQRAILSRLERAAAEWERVLRAPEALLGRRALTEAQALSPRRVGSSERALMDASARALTRATVRRWALRLALPAVVLVAAAPVIKARYDRAQTLHLLQRESDAALQSADELVKDARASERIAFTAFDVGREEMGEASWAKALEARRAADAAYARAQVPLEERVRRGDGSARAQLGDVALARFRLAQASPDASARASARERLNRWDEGGVRRRSLQQAATLEVLTEPANAQLTLARVELEGDRYQEKASQPLVSPLEGGSWMLEARAPGRVAVRCPLFLEPGEHRKIRLTLPTPGEIPPGFVYVPPGRSFYGSAEDEGLRRFFLNAEPLHPVDSEGFLVARYEVTFAEWMEYLRALPEEQRRRRSPSSGWHLQQLSLEPRPGGHYALALGVSDQHYRAEEGEPIRFPGRALRSTQEWTRFPISAVSFEDGEDYARWLARTGRVPGARLCNEHEWERAARGADARSFPAQEVLGPEDAAHDVTYGRRPDAFGPDEVGSHPASRSPFGVEDLAGNVWELVEGAHAPGQAIMRGGSWYQRDNDARVSNREPTDPDYRDPLVGLRLCATAPARLRRP